MNAIEDETLKEETHLGIMFLSLKHAYDQAMPYDEIFVQLGKVKNEKLLRRFLHAILQYIFNTREDADHGLLKSVVEQNLTESLGVEVMTLAEHLEKIGEVRGKKHGEKIGEKRGIKKGLLSAAVNLLKIGVDEKIVTVSTGFSLEEIQDLKQKHGLA